MLKKDPHTRLGAIPIGGTASIKNHPFFADLDWDKVRNREYKAPIRPKIKNPWDTKYFDKNLLKEKVKETNATEGGRDRITRPESMEVWNKMHFDNFTYVEEDNIAEMPFEYERQSDEIIEAAEEKEVVDKNTAFKMIAEH